MGSHVPAATEAIRAGADAVMAAVAKQQKGADKARSKLRPDGTYEAAPKTLSKFGYIAMMKARVHIVGVAYEMLAKAVTIAVASFHSPASLTEGGHGKEASTDHDEDSVSMGG